MPENEKEEIFPKDPDKTYALMEVVEGTSFHVDKGPENTVLSWPHLVLREFILFLLVFVVILALSLLFNAPLEEHANPLHPPNPAKAPWYFVGLQEWVSYSALYGGIFVPVLLVVFLFFLPYLDRNPKGVGVWFSRDRMLAHILFTAFIVIMILSILVGEYTRGPNWQFFWPWEPWVR